MTRLPNRSVVPLPSRLDNRGRIVLRDNRGPGDGVSRQHQLTGIYRTVGGLAALGYMDAVCGFERSTGIRTARAQFGHRWPLD